MVKIVIGGDLAQTESDKILFETGDVQGLLGRKLQEIWESADIRIFNLEAPVTKSENAIVKSGPNLKMSPKAMEGIKVLQPTVVSLANNHIMDYGPEGLEDTIRALFESKILTVGAGKNIEEASKEIIMEAAGIKVGLYSVAENEFSTAGADYPGANTLNINTAYQVGRIKEKVDYLIVLYHGGKEHYRYPTPGQQINCRYIADAGADLVLCQHSHCIGCEEKYKHSRIIYGQGNFIFDYKQEECWKTGIMVEIRIGETLETEILYHPYMRAETSIRYAEDESGRDILNGFYERSRDISQIDERWDGGVIEKEGPAMLKYLAGWSLLFRIIDKRLFHNFGINRFYSPKKMRLTLGRVRCETNREIIVDYLKKRLKTK